MARMKTAFDGTFGLRGLGALVAISAALATGSAQAQEASPADGVYADRVDWGILMDMSGPASSSQSVWVAGFRDYAAKLNEEGGVNGRRLNLLVEDNRFNAATDRIAFEKLVGQTPAIAVSGMGTSVSQVALAPTIKAGNLPVVGTYTSTQALSEPVSPMVYNGFCGYRQMAQAGVGYMIESLGLENPKVMTVAIETAGGQEYHEFVKDAVEAHGGTATLTTMSITAADVTAQVQQIMAQEPDFITIYGVDNTAILTMRTLQQYGIETPGFGITYLGAPAIYQALGAEGGANYSFISCFTPGGADEAEGNREMVEFAERQGNGNMAANINYVGGWVAGKLARQALELAGENPTRASLVEALEGGFTVEAPGLAAPIVYTPENHTGPRVLKMFGYDYETGSYVAYGDYADYEQFTASE